MTSDWRVVIDTSVAVSAVLLPRSIPRQAFDRALTVCRVLVSQETAGELEEVLRRPKFNRYVAETQRLEFLAALIGEAEVIEIRDLVRECRDAKDDKFLELAVNGQATHIITGDADLLNLNPFRGVAVVTPQAFLQLAR